MDKYSIGKYNALQLSIKLFKFLNNILTVMCLGLFNRN